MHSSDMERAQRYINSGGTKYNEKLRPCMKNFFIVVESMT